MNGIASRGIIVLAGVLLAWRIVLVDLRMYDENGYPQLPTQSAPGEKYALLQQILSENPGNILALLNLAREHEATGNGKEARRAYDAAFALAPVDREVLGARADYFLRTGGVAEAMSTLDRLVDAYPDTREIAFPVLARILMSGEQNAAWAHVLARQPEWVGSFIASTCAKGVDPGFLVPLLLDRVAHGRARAEEAGCVIDALRNADRWTQAYQVWLNTLPPERMREVGFIYNGSFEHPPSGVGFDWRLARGRERDLGYSVEVSPAPLASGKRALRVSFNGKRQSGFPVVQYLALVPGRYEMAGNAHPQSITAGRGVQWTMRCVRAGQPQPVLASSERFVGSSPWYRFSFDVSIPGDCPGQVLQLEPVGIADGPVYLAGLVWFDELVLRRSGQPQ